MHNYQRSVLRPSRHFAAQEQAIATEKRKR
jgi:hypothetical protein